MALISRSSYIGKILQWFTFFMAAPIFVPVFNITIYIFPILLYRFKLATGFLLKPKPLVQIPAFLFILGAVFSTLNSVNIASSLQVLPNYIYWGLLVIFLAGQSRHLDFDVIGKASLMGVLFSTIYYQTQGYLSNIPGLSTLSPNGYSFVLICFAPLAIHHLNKTSSRKSAILLLALLTVILLIDGRRAGFGLVLLGGILTLFGSKINFKQILVLFLLIISFFALLSSKIVEQFIQQSNERIYGLLYQTKDIRTKDVSYLIRIAMIKKGKSIYSEKPYTGIGLNNFTKYNAKISSDFEGAELALREKNINQTSAHNSYISLLAEGGLLMLVPFLLLLAVIIIPLIIQYNNLPGNHRAVIIAILMMCIHLYLVSAILNVFAWYLIGLCAALNFRK